MYATYKKIYNLIIPRFFLWKPAYSSCISLRIVECKSLAWALSWNIHVLEAKLQSLRTCRGQMPEDEDEAKDNLSRPRPRPRTKFRPRGQSGLEDLTSLVVCFRWSTSFVKPVDTHHASTRLTSSALFADHPNALHCVAAVTDNN